jgi:hypothetical protein
MKPVSVLIDEREGCLHFRSGSDEIGGGRFERSIKAVELPGAAVEQQAVIATRVMATPQACEQGRQFVAAVAPDEGGHPHLGAGGRRRGNHRGNVRSRDVHLGQGIARFGIWAWQPMRESSGTSSTDTKK